MSSISCSFVKFQNKHRSILIGRSYEIVQVLTQKSLVAFPVCQCKVSCDVCSNPFIRTLWTSTALLPTIAVEFEALFACIAHVSPIDNFCCLYCLRGYWKMGAWVWSLFLMLLIWHSWNLWRVFFACVVHNWYPDLIAGPDLLPLFNCDLSLMGWLKLSVCRFFISSNCNASKSLLAVMCWSCPRTPRVWYLLEVVVFRFIVYRRLSSRTLLGLVALLCWFLSLGSLLILGSCDGLRPFLHLH